VVTQGVGTCVSEMVPYADCYQMLVLEHCPPRSMLQAYSYARNRGHVM
jgi:hypothetical protein